MSPCLLCAEKSCHNCPCAIVDFVDNVPQETNLMESAKQNKDDCAVFIKRLASELKQIEWDNEPVNHTKQNWRGFPAGQLDKNRIRSMDAGTLLNGGRIK